MNKNIGARMSQDVPATFLALMLSPTCRLGFKRSLLTHSEQKHERLQLKELGVVVKVLENGINSGKIISKCLTFVRH